MNYEEKKAIESRVGDVIDSAWHYSWHWDRNAYGGLSLKGWRQAKADGEKLLNSLKARAKGVEDMLGQVAKVIEYEEQFEGEIL